MTVYIRFILNRLGRLGIRKKNAGNTWKQGHKQKIFLLCSISIRYYYYKTRNKTSLYLPSQLKVVYLMHKFVYWAVGNPTLFVNISGVRAYARVLPSIRLYFLLGLIVAACLYFFLAARYYNSSHISFTALHLELFLSSSVL